jgi:chromosome segregation protein
LLADWLHGCYTARSFEDALASRDKLQAGEVIYVQSGHAVAAHSVSFYAQDSEQAGLLARQQEIENLEKQLRAQALIAEEARSALVRAEAAYTDASQRMVSARREAAETQSRAHELRVEPASRPVSRTDAHRERSPGTWPRWTPRWRSCRNAA